MARVIQRLAGGLLATAAFTVVLGTSPASANDPILVIVQRTLGWDDECDPLCPEPGEDCVGNDENYEGRICLPSGTLDAVTYAVFTAEGVADTVVEEADDAGVPLTSPYTQVRQTVDDTL